MSSAEVHVGHSYVHDDISRQSSVTLIALHVIGIWRDEVVLFASSTQSSFTVEIVTELVVLLGKVLIYFIVKSKTSINVHQLLIVRNPVV